MRSLIITKPNNTKYGRAWFVKGLATLVLGVLFGSFLMLGRVNNVSAAVTSSLTLSIDDSAINVDIASLKADGTFAESSNSTISASTNNATGYTMKLASTDDTAGANTKLSLDSDNYLSSITTKIAKSAFSADANNNGTDYNNMWGYAPSQYYDSANDTFIANTGNNPYFFPAPDETGDMLAKTDTANTTPNEYNLAIGARIDSSTKIGAYTNTFNVILVANAIPYTVTYIDDVVGNMPNDVDTTVAQGSTAYVASNTPTRNGYTFLGWCSVTPTANANGTDTCSGTQYSAGAALPVSSQSGASNDFVLHAMWGGNYTIDAFIAAGSTMQDFTYMDARKKGKIVASMKEETNYTLKDSRDNQNYTIALLKDGNVWMTKNLNIAGGTTLTCDKTDCDGGYVLPSNQGWQSTAGKLPASSTTGFSSDNYAYVYNSGNTTNCGASGQNTPCYSYYSWDAATLGSGRSIATQNTDAPYSICPKGWRLPTSGQHDGTTAFTNWKRGDFYRLLTAYGANLESAYNQSTTTFYNNAGPGTTANFLLSGYYSGSTFYYGGANGYYWSSTSTSSTYSRNLYFSTGYVYSADYYDRRYGFSVRCMLR